MLEVQCNQISFESTERAIYCTLDVILVSVFVLKISTMHAQYFYLVLFLLVLVS